MSPHPRLSPRPRRRAPRGAGLLALVLALAAGCSDGSRDPDPAPDPLEGPPVPAAGSREVQRDVRDLITALTPLPTGATPGEMGDWHRRRQAILERQRAGGPELGREALRMYLERPDALEKVRSGLLDVAAHGVPDPTRPILVELITTFNEYAELRRDACGYLARTSPATAVEVLGEILAQERPRMTYPPMGSMLEAWIFAAKAEGIDPVETLARVGTDLMLETNVRTLALRTLGEYESPVGRQALQAVLIESSGNHYLRRVSAQALLESLPREEFCDVIRDVLEKEVDIHFQMFLADCLETHCR